MEKEKKGLADKVEAVQKFLSTRVLWSAYTQDLSTRLPPGTVIEALDGASELEGSGKKGGGPGKKAFTLRVVSPSKQDGSIPRELDAFLKSLRNHPLWMRDFTSIDVTDIKRAQVHGSKLPSVSFTIVCSPKNATGSSGPPPSGAGGAEDKKEHK